MTRRDLFKRMAAAAAVSAGQALFPDIVFAATPTTVRHLSGESGPPILSRLPIGSALGHARAATSALTMATSGAPRRSASVKVRPRSMGTPRVWK